MIMSDNARSPSWFQGLKDSDDIEDLLYFLTLMVRKAMREPETADASLAHAMRAFDKIVETMA